ncbi:MAG TPA: ribosome maturation factor RimP [Solimonas sp.]|nr:ribosome maturation factor RimP [Solimonas sp.]
MLRDKLVQLLEPVIESLGYELVLLEYSPSTHNSLLRIYVDSPGGINLEDCERVSREITGILDVEDPIPTSYQLEVSSPGLDRPLTKVAHFERFVNEQARVQLLAPRDGRRKFNGRIRAVSETAVTIETPEGATEIPYPEIERARLVPDYDREWAGKKASKAG